MDGLQRSVKPAPHAPARIDEVRLVTVVCYENYDEVQVVGDPNLTTIQEKLSGPEMAKLRRWSCGIEEAPNDFIYRNCVLALHR